MADMTFKESQKIVMAGDYGRKGQTANFGFYGGDKELNETRSSDYLEALRHMISKALFSYLR